MKTTTNNRQFVTHRPKGNKPPRKPARRLADEPAMKELARMMGAGEVNRERTLAHLKQPARSSAKRDERGRK